MIYIATHTASLQVRSDSTTQSGALASYLNMPFQPGGTLAKDDLMYELAYKYATIMTIVLLRNSLLMNYLPAGGFA